MIRPGLLRVRAVRSAKPSATGRNGGTAGSAGTLTWLHLSDLHFSGVRTAWDATRVINTLVKDLQAVQKLYGLRPDLIFFTGDLAFGQLPDTSLPDQYVQGARFLEAVRNAFSPAVDRSRLFLVPGNHDVDRTRVGRPDTLWLDSLKGDPGADTVSECLRTANLEWRRFMERLAPYRAFLEKHHYRHLLQDPARLVYAIPLEINGLRVGVGGVNTAWSCCREEESARLWLGRWQLEEVYNRLSGSGIRVLLSHHPLNWFRPEENPLLKRQIQNDFDFHLHGHEHQEWADTLTNHVRIAAGACYERSDKKNGYSFVRLEPRRGRGRIWFRMYEGSGWVPRVIPSHTDVHGCWEFDAIWLDPRLAEKMRSFRAEILRIPELDVEITEGPSERPADEELEIAAIPAWVPTERRSGRKRK
jgi:predicted MPP superfamily phosphohydrolase